MSQSTGGGLAGTSEIRIDPEVQNKLDIQKAAELRSAEERHAEAYSKLPSSKKSYKDIDAAKKNYSVDKKAYEDIQKRLITNIITKQAGLKVKLESSDQSGNNVFMLRDDKGNNTYANGYSVLTESELENAVKNATIGYRGIYKVKNTIDELTKRGLITTNPDGTFNLPIYLPLKYNTTGDVKATTKLYGNPFGAKMGANVVGSHYSEETYEDKVFEQQ
jgi:hypothetical protein